jgi:hypothetical protein
MLRNSLYASCVIVWVVGGSDIQTQVDDKLELETISQFNCHFRCKSLFFSAQFNLKIPILRQAAPPFLYICKPKTSPSAIR